MAYRAEMRDGTLVVFDVPVFAECSKKGNNFDAKWLGDALAAAQMSEREEFFPPMHVRHHGSDDVIAAGFFRITRASPITLRGSQRLALFADLHFTSEHVASLVMQGKLPYRSVEIHDVGKPAINSLALLDHEAPFLRLPMLMVSTPEQAVTGGTFASGWTCEGPSETDSVAAYFSAGSKALVLFRDDPIEVAMADGKDDKKQDGEGGDKMEAAKVDVGAVCKAIASGEITLADMDAIMSAISAYQSKGQDKGDDKEAQAPAPGNAAMKDDDKQAVKFAELQAEVDGLKAVVTKQKADAKRREDVAKAMHELSGRALGATLEDDLIKFHEFGDAAFTAYVERLKSVVPPAASHDGAGVPGHDVPEVALAFQNDGPDAVAKAMRFAADWDQLTEAGYHGLSRDDYVKSNMQRVKERAAASRN